MIVLDLIQVLRNIQSPHSWASLFCEISRSFPISWLTQIQTFFLLMSIPRSQIDISLWSALSRVQSICTHFFITKKPHSVTLHCFKLDVASPSLKEELLYFSYLVLALRISTPASDSKNPFMANIFCFSKATCQSLILACLTRVVATIAPSSSSPQGPYLSQVTSCYYVSAKAIPKPSTVYCPQQEALPEHSGLLTPALKTGDLVNLSVFLLGEWRGTLRKSKLYVFSEKIMF